MTEIDSISLLSVSFYFTLPKKYTTYYGFYFRRVLKKRAGYATGNEGQPIAIMGDFNAAIGRGKRFDKALETFLERCHLIDGIHLSNQDLDFSWSNGSDKAIIDHIIFNKESSYLVKSCKLITSMWNLGDHLSLSAEINCIPSNSTENNNPVVLKKKS